MKAANCVLVVCSITIVHGELTHLISEQFGKVYITDYVLRNYTQSIKFCTRHNSSLNTISSQLELTLLLMQLHNLTNFYLGAISAPKKQLPTKLTNNQLITEFDWDYREPNETVMMQSTCNAIEISVKYKKWFLVNCKKQLMTICEKQLVNYYVNYFREFERLLNQIHSNDDVIKLRIENAMLKEKLTAKERLISEANVKYDTLMQEKLSISSQLAVCKSQLNDYVIQSRW